MMWPSAIYKRLATLRQIALTLAVMCLTVCGTLTLSLAQQPVPRISQTESQALSRTPYTLEIESRLTFISGLYRQMPRLFLESAKYEFDMLQILTDQQALMNALNAEAEYQNAIQNRPPLASITVTPLGNQGNRTQVPVRGELPQEAIDDFKTRLRAAAELVDAELSKTQRAWGAEAVAALILADYARLDPAKPNPGAIVAALQSLLSAAQKREASALKDFKAKLEYLARNVDPALVQDPTKLDPARLKLSGTPTLADLIKYCTEYTATKEGLGDRLALFAQLNASSQGVTSKASMLESIGRINYEQLVYLSDEGDILRPLVERLGGSQAIADQSVKSVLSVLNDVFAKAPTTLVELSPVVLVEQPWWYGILRGFVSGDCSSQHSFAYPNDPGERTFFISDPSAPGEYKGIVTASSVMKGGKRSLYILTIHGPRLGPADVYSVIYGLDQIKGQLGFDAIELPTKKNLDGLVNREDLRAAMEAIASRGEAGSIRYQNDRVRDIIEKLRSGYNRGEYDKRSLNTQARSFSPDPQVSRGLAASNSWATLQMVDPSKPSKATALQMFRDLLHAKGWASMVERDALETDLKQVGQRWGIDVGAVNQLMEASKNPKELPFREFEAEISHRLTAILDTPSELPRGAESGRSLLESRPDWFRTGYSLTPDLLSPENAAQASRVLRDFASDLRFALKDAAVPAYLFNNPKLLLSEPILWSIVREGLIQGKEVAPGLDLAAQLYRQLLTGEKPEYTSSGRRLNDTVLDYYDHTGAKIQRWPAVIDELPTNDPYAPRRGPPLAEGPTRTAVEGLLYRYEVALLQRARNQQWLTRDIVRSGRPDSFWTLYREAARTWQTANVEDYMKPQILDIAVRRFGEKFSPTYLELVPIVHAQGGDYRANMVEFLKSRTTFPPSLLDWYVNGFLGDYKKFPPEALSTANVPDSVWTKIQEIPREWASPFLRGQRSWPQSTLDWFLTKFGSEGFSSLSDWELLSVLNERGQVPPAVLDRAVQMISSDKAPNFLWEGKVPAQIQEAFLQRAYKVLEERILVENWDGVMVEQLNEGKLWSDLASAAKYLSDIPKALFDKVLDLYISAEPSGIRDAAQQFLLDTSSRWPESFKESLLRSVAPNPSNGYKWSHMTVLGMLLKKLSITGSVGSLEGIMNFAFRNSPGREAVYGNAARVPAEFSRNVMVNLNASTFLAFWRGYLSSVPDRFAIFEGAGALANAGITLRLEVPNSLIRSEPNGAQTISATDLILSIMQDRMRGIGWTVDARNPSSVGDMVALADYLSAQTGRPIEGGRVIHELRTALRENVRPPTAPGEVVVRGGPTFTSTVTEVVSKFGGSVYTGEGGRTRVVYGDGSVVEFPSVVSRDYTSVIGDRVAFIDVVGGTATGAAAQAIARDIPSDVYGEFNRLNPVAGNQYVQEGVNQVIDRMAEGGRPPVIGGLPIEGIVDGQLAVGRRGTFENLRNAYYEAGWEANFKAYEMINATTKWRQGFGVAGMIGSFVALETANSIFDQQMGAIAAGNWEAFDASYRDAVNKLPETTLHTAAGLAVFEGAGLAFGAMSTAGAALTAEGSVALGAAATGVGAAGSVALSATGIGFVALALAHEVDEIGKAEALMTHLDEQAAQVGMSDDSWAYSDNSLYRQWQLEAEVGVHLVGGAWNGVKEAISEAFTETVMKALGSPDGKVWAFDDSFEQADIAGDGSRPNPIPAGDLMEDWVDASALSGNGSDAAAEEEPFMRIPEWLQDMANKGSFAARGLNGLLETVHDVFPSLVGAPSTRATSVLNASVQKPPPSVSPSARMPGVFERMEDAIRRMNDRTGEGPSSPDDIRLDDLVAELGADPVAWSEAFEAGLISMADIERVFGRMKAAEPEDPNAPPPPQIVKAPASVVVAKGKPFSLSAQATGENLHYVWALDGEPLVSLEGATLSVASADFDDAGAYVAYVSNGKTMVASPPAQVTVVGFVEQPPANISVAAGKSVTLAPKLSASNATYQWSKNGQPIAGATGPALTIPSVKVGDAGVYAVTAKVGELVVTSESSAVNILEMVKEPEFRVTTVGSRTTLTSSGKITLASGGAGSVTYQWLKGGVAIPSQTTAVLAIASAQKSDTAKYSVRLTHEGTTVESAQAHLEVIDRAANAVSLSTTPAFTCAIPQTTGGSVSCKQTVGNNRWGEVTPGTIMGATSLALGVRHGCAINALSKVACWGDGSAAQTSPPADLTGVVSLALGPTYSCALLNTGLVRCWGGGIVPPGVNQVIALESSVGGICAKTLAGERLCWGS